MKAFKHVTTPKTYSVTINLVILLYGVFCDTNLRISFIVRMDLYTDPACSSLTMMPNMESNILISKHLNYFPALCPVTLKTLAWYSSIMVLTPSIIILFPPELWGNKRHAVYKKNPIQGWHLCGTEELLQVMGPDVFVGTSVFLSNNFAFWESHQFAMNIFGSGNNFNCNIVIFKLAWIYNRIEFGGRIP